MTDDLYALDAHDFERLRKLLAAYEQGRLNRQHADAPTPHGKGQDTFLVQVTGDVLAGMTGQVQPCRVTRGTTPSATPNGMASYPLLLWNNTTAKIAGGTQMVVVREPSSGYLVPAGGGSGYATLIANVYDQTGLYQNGDWWYPINVVANGQMTAGWLAWPSDCPPQQYQSGTVLFVEWYHVYASGSTANLYNQYPVTLDPKFAGDVPVYNASAVAPYAQVQPPFGAWPPGGSQAGVFVAQAGLAVEAPYVAFGSGFAPELGLRAASPGFNFAIYVGATGTQGTYGLYQGATGVDGVGNTFVNGLNVGLGAGTTGATTTTDGGSLW